MYVKSFVHGKVIKTKAPQQVHDDVQNLFNTTVKERKNNRYRNLHKYSCIAQLHHITQTWEGVRGVGGKEHHSLQFIE